MKNFEKIWEKNRSKHRSGSPRLTTAFDSPSAKIFSGAFFEKAVSYICNDNACQMKIDENWSQKIDHRGLIAAGLNDC
ncbi:MAG: hypothetical protein LBP21_06600 [Synergistaceae bacterium]|nr:hypothetical protein [Synergistaceae bacterium]